MRSVVALGIPVLAEINHGLPDASDGVPIPTDQIVVVGETERAPLALPRPEPDPITDAVGHHDRVPASQQRRDETLLDVQRQVESLGEVNALVEQPRRRALLSRSVRPSRIRQ